MKFKRVTLTFVMLAVGLSTGVVLRGAEAGTFTPTGSMNEQRALHRATLFQDSSGNTMVLITGGIADRGAPGNVPTAEIFDPGLGTFILTPGSPTAARTFHRATLLQDGRVLITGGDSRGGGAGGTVFNTAEIFDPMSETFIATDDMTGPRAGHTATLLPGGTVLITGGSDGSTVLRTAEIFDPILGTFSPTGSMTKARTRHTATLLLDGRVLVAGGFGEGGLLDSAEIFNPATGSFTLIAEPMTRPRGDDHTATLLQGGTVLLAGGQTFRLPRGFFPTRSAEIYDPFTNSFRETAHSMAGRRNFHSATLLSDGTVLIAGGFLSVATFRAAIYDPTTEKFSENASGMTVERVNHTATSLGDGTVLITGGFGKVTGSSQVVHSSAEIFTP